MNNKELIDKIISLYRSARKSKHPAPDHYPETRIVRGRSHTISSEVEDLFAYFFLQYTSHDIGIDLPIGRIDTKPKKTFYPDITLQKDGKIHNFFDIKMDLGWNRDNFIDYCKEKSKLIKEIRNKKVTYWDHEVTILEKVKYNIVVVSELNISNEKLEKLRSDFKVANVKDKVSLIFLTKGEHPNVWEKEETKNVLLNHSEFKRLIEMIKS